jgi:pimeloyl-ACP methyl ester carboxylesterase
MLEKDNFAEVDHLYALWSPHWKAARQHAEGVKDALRPKGRARAAVDYYSAPLTEDDRRAFSKNLSMPALVIYGEDEPDVRKSLFGRATSTVCGPVTCKEYSKVGHWPHLEDPDRFERDVVSFLEANAIS